ncbi:MAG: sulfotransferase, partial [Alphaproteobacteria bacterium]
PDIFVPIAKDIKYFDRHPNRPLEWYLSFFADAGDAKAIGEMSHDYFLDPAIARQIRRHFPEIKIIFGLREPVERTISRWLFARATEIGSSVSFGDFARSPAIIAENDYLANLKPYFEQFPRAQLFVVFYLDVMTDPAGVVRQLYRFLGANEDYVPPSLYKRVLPARKARIAPLGRLAYAAAQRLRLFGGANIVGSVKRSSLFEQLLYKELRQRPYIAEKDALWIRDRFSPDYKALEKLIGRPLPHTWWSRSAAIESLIVQSAPKPGMQAPRAQKSRKDCEQSRNSAFYGRPAR